MVTDAADTLIQALELRVREAEHPSPGAWERPDDMAWAAVGLGVHEAAPNLVDRLRTGLAERQRKDGAVPLEPNTPRACWPTSLALLAWRGDSAFAGPRRAAADYLLHHRGSVMEMQPPLLGHDVTIHGWPWIADTHSWVEPTALALMGLKTEGLRKHPAVNEAVEVLRDRMLPDGGWNYGNTEVYGSVLLPMPECTGIALCAMHDELTEAEAEKSIAYLESEYPCLNTPLSLSWTIMGLSAWGRRPKNSREKVAESLALEDRYGPFKAALLGLLAACLTDFPFHDRGDAP